MPGHLNPCPPAQVVLLYGTVYIVFMCAIWWPVKDYWVYSGEFDR